MGLSSPSPEVSARRTMNDDRPPSSPRADGSGRVAAHEVLVRTAALPNIIREGNTGMLATTIQNGRSQGMQMMDDALEELLAAGRIHAEDAYRKAENKRRFEALLPTEA